MEIWLVFDHHHPIWFPLRSLKSDADLQRKSMTLKLSTNAQYFVNNFFFIFYFFEQIHTGKKRRKTNKQTSRPNRREKKRKIWKYLLPNIKFEAVYLLTMRRVRKLTRLKVLDAIYLDIHLTMRCARKLALLKILDTISLDINCK